MGDEEKRGWIQYDTVVEYNYNSFGPDLMRINLQ